MSYAQQIFLILGFSITLLLVPVIYIKIAKPISMYWVNEKIKIEKDEYYKLKGKNEKLANEIIKLELKIREIKGE